MYDREVEGQQLTLGVSGQVWKNSLVLYDQETQSLWSHLLGEAKAGPLTGKKLRPLPAVLTDWQTWRCQHPEGTVVWLDRTSLEVRPESRRADFLEQPQRFVLGIAGGQQAKAWGLDELSQTPVRNDHWNGQPVLVVWDPARFTARLYARTVQAQVLTFQLVGDLLQDQETGSTWEAASGRAVAGPLAGKELLLLPAMTADRDVWEQVHRHAPP